MLEGIFLAFIKYYRSAILISNLAGELIPASLQSYLAYLNKNKKDVVMYCHVWLRQYGNHLEQEH